MNTCGHNCRKLRGYECSACADPLTAESYESLIDKIKKHDSLKCRYIRSEYGGLNLFAKVSFSYLLDGDIKFLNGLVKEANLLVSIWAIKNAELELIFTSTHRNHE